MNRMLVAAAAAMLLVGCKRPSPECRARTQHLRERIATIDWSVVVWPDAIPYLEIPIGDGARIGDSGSFHVLGAVVWVHGGRIEASGRKWPADDPSLDEWLPYFAGILHQKPWPVYVLATGSARMKLVRRVVEILKPMGQVWVAVRPARVVEPWLPRKDRQAFFDYKTRRVPSEKDKEWKERDQELAMSVLVPAEGCSEAVKVAKHPWMSPGDRLGRLPDAFEKCACDGDMDTMAALYWFQSLEGLAAIHWLEWSDALAEHVGDDATYAELARALTDRYVASQQRKNE